MPEKFAVMVPGPAGWPPQGAAVQAQPPRAAGHAAGPRGRTGFSARCPPGPNRLDRAAQAGHRDPSPAKDLAVPAHALATPEGIRQVAHKVAVYRYGHADSG